MAAAGEVAFRSELVGRGTELGTLREHLNAAREGRGRVVLVAGEAGIGKSRLLEELTGVARGEGFEVLPGTCFHGSITPYAAFLEAFREGGLDHLFLEEPLRVESLYAIDSAGLVLAKAERVESPLDPDIFTSMIRVVEEFLKDAVRAAGGKGKERLNVLGLGDYRLFLQPGKHATIVAVLTGRENEFLIEDLREALARIDAEYGAVLADWAGTLEDIEGMYKHLKPILASRKYEGVDPAGGDPQLRRNRLFENVSLGLVHVAQDRPLLLTLDDLQWADPSTIALVHYIARGIQAAPVLLVGAYRSEEIAMGLHGAKHPLEEAIQLMSREGLHHEVRIARLGETETTKLVESLLGKVDLAAEEEREVFRASGGNPFFLIEIARLVVQEGLLVRDGEVWRFTRRLRDVEIPTRVYHVIVRRLQRVQGEGRDVLEFAAILGDEFATDVLASCVGRERITLLRDLRELEGTHQLIRSAQVRYRFDHPQIREVLLREMPEGIRREYHRIAGESLERIHGDRLAEDYRLLSEVAYHFYEARDPAKGVAYSMDAGAAAKAAYANEEAIRFHAQALELLNDAAPERPAALEARADLEELIGRYDEAIADYRAALDLVPDAATVARLRRKVGAIHQRRGKYEDADRELRAGASALGDTRTAEAGVLALWLGRTAAGRGDYEAAMAEYGRAREILEDAPDRDELDLAEAQYSAGMVHYMRANLEPASARELIGRAREEFQRCLETRRRRGDEIGMRPALNMLAITYAAEGNHEEAVGRFSESIRIGERVGDLRGITRPLVNLGRIYRMLGDGSKALDTYQRALGILLKVGDQAGLASVYLNAAEVYLARGDRGHAADYYGRSLEYAERVGDKVQRAGALHGLGVANLERGDHEAAAKWLARSIDAFEGIGAWEFACRSTADLVRALLIGGDVERAQTACERAHGYAAEAKTPKLVGVCDAVEASVARASGDLARAEALLDAAEGAFEGHPSDLDVAAVAFERGSLLRARGQAGEAAEAFGRAAEAAAKAGRPGLADLARGSV